MTKKLQAEHHPKAMTKEEISRVVHEYISENFLFDAEKKLDEEESFLGSGAIDSTGIMELIGFVGERFDVNFHDDELIGENFDSVGKITDFIFRKTQQRKP